MNTESRYTTSPFFFIGISGIFLIIISPALLSEGMFMDGVLYATISKNLANGMGTFWKPHMSETLFPVFVNHPPLAFGLESIFFRLFGESRFTERIYSLSMIVLTGVIIFSIWKSLGRKSSTGWLPLLFWIIIPSVSWATVNNMLENTMGVFICLSVLFYLKSLDNNRTIFLFISGLSLSFGFLTKGFVTFFPLSLPFFLWLFTRKHTFLSMVADTMIILISSLLPLIAIYSLIPGAREILPEYLSITFDLVADSVTKESRFYIIYRLLMELLPALAAVLVFILFCRTKKIPLGALKSKVNISASFFALGLSGVLPIMITRVQSGFYLLTSLPFFAISLSLLICPLGEILLEKINPDSKGLRIFKYISIILFITGIILSASFSGHISRDQNKISDMKIITAELPQNSTISILPDMYYDWSLHSYYGRYHNISLDPDLNNRHIYLLINKSFYSDTMEYRFEKIQLNTNEFELFRRKQ